MPINWTDAQRAEFIDKLDGNHSVRLSGFEAEFVSSNVAKFDFSPKQRVIIDRLIEKHRDALKW